jgi:hypothetical protein
MKSHAPLRSFAKLVREFARSESGITLPLLAFSLVMITSAVGMSIDVARAQLVQSKLQFSLDAAGLAGGSTVSTTALNTEVAKYLNTNFNHYLNATITTTGVTVDPTNTVITLTATATLPTTFMNVVGVKQMTVQANSQISRAVTGLELVMVLDNTGSMGNPAGAGVSKIAALKTAANSLVDTLFQGQATAPAHLYVGLVPFSQAVNIGTSHATWLDTAYDTYIPDATKNASNPPAASTDWGPLGKWGGCVDARSNGYDLTDDPPSTATTATLFREYYWLSDRLNSDGVTNGGANLWKTVYWKKCNLAGGSCTTQTTTLCTPDASHTCKLTNSVGGVGPPTYTPSLSNTTAGPNYLCPPQPVVPMTTTKATLTTAINNMTAAGDTLINQGMQWGFNMISPRWNGLWGGTMNANNLPLPYGTKGMNKAIVLLTDGENTIDNTSHGAFWFLGDAKAGTTNGTTALSTLNSRTLQICTTLKNNGVYIYTIALGTDVTAADLSFLQSCATASNYAFNSPSTAQLQSIFAAIGDSLSNLRVSQ